MSENRKAILGGFICPIIFGLSLACLYWMHIVIRRMVFESAPHLAHEIEHPEASGAQPEPMAS